jgi:nickel-dependent lactate racemase
MVGDDMVRRLRIVNHDARNRENLIRIGETETGLAVWVNKTVADASLKILTGLITPHHSTGYSGGRKSLLTGVAGLDTLKHFERIGNIADMMDLPVGGQHSDGVIDNPLNQPSLN